MPLISLQLLNPLLWLTQQNIKQPICLLELFIIGGLSQKILV